MRTQNFELILSQMHVYTYHQKLLVAT